MSVIQYTVLKLGYEKKIMQKLKRGRKNSYQKTLVSEKKIIRLIVQEALDNFWIFIANKTSGLDLYYLGKTE